VVALSAVAGVFLHTLALLLALAGAGQTRAVALGLAAVAIPEGVTLLDDVQETMVATLSPPRLQVEVEEEIEAETEVVGEGEEPGEAAEGAEGADAEGSSGEE